MSLVWTLTRWLRVPSKAPLETLPSIYSLTPCYEAKPSNTACTHGLCQEAGPLTFSATLPGGKAFRKHRPELMYPISSTHGSQAGHKTRQSIQIRCHPECCFFLAQFPGLSEPTDSNMQFLSIKSQMDMDSCLMYIGRQRIKRCQDNMLDSGNFHHHQ